jgi:alpha-methylacyl-CoA racemase
MKGHPVNPPLTGVRVVEFEGIGPGPLAGRMLADMGAQVTVIARPTPGILSPKAGAATDNPLRHGKTVVTLDLKNPADVAQAMALVATADALIEGNRPGVMERLGLGPADCAAHNPKLIYGRMTGWGQSGPLAQAAGHDLNYVALTGLLSLSAHRGERPVVPPTVVGDAGGALGLAFGIACALFDVRISGKGRVVDAAIVDIVAMLGGIAQLARARSWLDSDGLNLFHDSPFYDVYPCAEGGFITLGAIEPQFYALLLHKLGMGDVDAAAQNKRAEWPALKARFTALFASQRRAHWVALLEGTDVCFAPVLSLKEAVAHPHNVARGVYSANASGTLQVAPAPRFLPLDGV